MVVEPALFLDIEMGHSLTSQGEQDFEENQKTAKGSPDEQVQMNLAGRNDLHFQYKECI